MSQRRPRGPEPPGPSSFAREVVEPIRIQHDGKALDYQAYLALPEDRRSNDEAAVVDQKFSRNLLKWLGYGEDDWIYNRPIRESGPQNVPDYRVSPAGMLAFVVEDKNTTERFTRRHIDQMRRYVAGTAGYAIWTNGCEVVGLRIPTQGEAEILVRIQVRPAAGAPDQGAKIELLRELFCRNRYTELPRILDRICVDEDAWERTDISSPGAQHLVQTGIVRGPELAALHQPGDFPAAVLRLRQSAPPDQDLEGRGGQTRSVQQPVAVERDPGQPELAAEAFELPVESFTRPLERLGRRRQLVHVPFVEVGQGSAQQLVGGHVGVGGEQLQNVAGNDAGQEREDRTYQRAGNAPGSVCPGKFTTGSGAICASARWPT